MTQPQHFRAASLQESTMALYLHADIVELTDERRLAQGQILVGHYSRVHRLKKRHLPGTSKSLPETHREKRSRNSTTTGSSKVIETIAMNQERCSPQMGQCRWESAAKTEAAAASSPKRGCGRPTLPDANSPLNIHPTKKKQNPKGCAGTNSTKPPRTKTLCAVSDDPSTRKQAKPVSRRPRP